jgi:hypothetical protein
MPEELKFIGIEEGVDGVYRAVHLTRDNRARILINEQEPRDPCFLSQPDRDYTLGNRKEALQALQEANPVKWPEEIEA